MEKGSAGFYRLDTIIFTDFSNQEGIRWGEGPQAEERGNAGKASGSEPEKKKGNKGAG